MPAATTVPVKTSFIEPGDGNGSSCCGDRAKILPGVGHAGHGLCQVVGSRAFASEASAPPAYTSRGSRACRLRVDVQLPDRRWAHVVNEDVGLTDQLVEDRRSVGWSR
jgi:hypothetical protein